MPGGHPGLRRDSAGPRQARWLADAEERFCLPSVEDKAVDGLKFSVALPRYLAEATLAQRLADLDGARFVLAEPQRFVTA